MTEGGFGQGVLAPSSAYIFPVDVSYVTFCFTGFSSVIVASTWVRVQVNKVDENYKPGQAQSLTAADTAPRRWTPPSPPEKQT